MNVIVMTNSEEFLQFLDPELCTLVETHEKGGLRTLSLDYKFQDLHEDKQLFKIGNKVWVSGDANLSDCLYVINTPVETNVYAENSFSMELEEVMVELNYAPIFSQTDLTSENGFKITTTNGEQSVTINWNALNYWFGDYFNIGVVQKCLNENYNRVPLSGTMTLMSLLRYIEEETGNVFVTRYEKDPLTNVIHRYLDFLNPIDTGKDWELNIEYDFVQGVEDSGVYDENDDPSSDEDEYADTESQDDLVDFTPTGTAWTNVDPNEVEFRITDKDYNLLDADGLIYTTSSEADPLQWTSDDIGFDDDVNNVVITLSSVSNVVGLICNEKSFVVPASDEYGVSYGNGYLDLDNIDTPTTTYTCSVPDDSYFTIYDTNKERTVYSTCINREIGHTHEEILDIGFNLDNVIFETDESDTFTAIAPILTLDNMEGLNKNDMSKIIGYWKNLSIEKGTTIPMIMEKITVQASSLAKARASMGTSTATNYYSRPSHPQDNIDTNTPSNSQWEFWRGTAYWKAPFTKNAGEMFVSLDQEGSIEYTNINPRPDWREERTIRRPKIGSVETSHGTVYAIYNDVCMKLKDKMTPSFDITVDVANLRKGRYNDYQLHDKVYVKLPDYQELVTARVSKTVKEAHDVAKNTISLDNYSINAVKNVQKRTYLDASNTSFKYPNSKDLTVRLVNEDYDSQDEYSVQYPANKLISFMLYKVENNSSTLTKTSYTKLTDAYGYATINMAYDPGDYELSIRFGGDEEYEETSIIIQVNVSGTKEVYEPTITKTKSKPVKKTAKKKKSTKKKKVTNKAKKVTSSKTRTSTYIQPADLKKKALSIVGDSTGLDAAKKIARWCGTKKHFRYADYKNYKRRAARAYKMRSANCCDSTRMMLSMMDAVGCSEKLKLEYVHCHNSAARKGHVFAKITTRATGKYRYVDPCCKLENGRSPWANHLKGYGPIVSINAYTGPNSSPF